MEVAEYARRVFALDLRSLALMRIGVGITVLVDLATRAVDLTAHYSDAGVLPRAIARELSWTADVSLLAISGSPGWTTAVFVITAIAAVAVIAGWRTRITTPVLWLLVLSIQHRNPIVHDHRDVLFSLALCFGSLLPWGATWSVDQRRALATRYTGAPAIAYVVTLGAVYLFAAALKSGDAWRSDFTAVEHAIGVRYWASSRADALLEHPSVMAFLTVSVLAFEIAVLPLLLAPWRPRLTRWLAITGLVALQLGFAIFLWLDTFPLISTTLVLGLIPWRTATDAPPPSRARTRVSAVLLGYVLALDLLSVAAPDLRALDAPAELLGIEQRWTMFAPEPSRVDGWFVLTDGATDLLTGEPVSWSWPDSFRAGIRTTRELVYLRRLLAYDAARDSFAAAYCTPGRTISLSFVPVLAGVRQPTELLVEHSCSGTLGR